MFLSFLLAALVAVFGVNAVFGKAGRKDSAFIAVLALVVLVARSVGWL